MFIQSDRLIDGTGVPPVAAPVLPEIGLGCANVLRASLPDLIDAAQRHGFRRATAHPYMFAAALGFSQKEFFDLGEDRKTLTEAPQVKF